MKSAPTETWFVWFSEEWSPTLMDLQFADSIYGDVLIAHRDNKGRTLQTGPLEHIISIHPRVIQMDPVAYFRYYSTAADRNERLIYVSTTDYIVNGIDKVTQTPLAITDMMVIPTDANVHRHAWIFLSYVVAEDMDSDGRVDAIPITQTQRVDVCAPINVEEFIQNLGDLRGTYVPRTCKLNGLFDVMRKSSLLPVMMPSSTLGRMEMLLIPTSASGGVEACILTMQIDDLYQVSEAQGKVCFNTPASFVTNANFPTRPGWIDFARTTFMGAEEAVGSSPSITQQGVTVFARRVLAQNTLSVFSLSDAKKSIIQFFGTGNVSSSNCVFMRMRITDGRNSKQATPTPRVTGSNRYASRCTRTTQGTGNDQCRPNPCTPHSSRSPSPRTTTATADHAWAARPSDYRRCATLLSSAL